MSLSKHPKPGALHGSPISMKMKGCVEFRGFVQ